MATITTRSPGIASPGSTSSARGECGPSSPARSRSRSPTSTGRYGALDNHCPHQGGPLGEGTIENGLLRCPWHGFDYCPLTGAVARRLRRRRSSRTRSRSATTASTSASADEPSTCARCPTRWPRRWSRGAIDTVFGMVGHSNLGLADAIRRREQAGELEYIGIRHEGAAAFAASAYAQAHRPPGRVPDDRRPGRDEPADRAVGREGRPRAGARADRPGRVAGARRPAPSRRSTSRAAFAPVAAWSQTVLPSSQARRAHDPGLQARDPQARRRAPRLPRRRADDPGAGRARRRAGRPAHGARHRAAGAAGRRRARAACAAARAAGVHRRPRRARGHGGGHRARRARCTRRSSRRSRPRARSPTTTRSPCGVLGRSGTPVASWLMNEADLLVVLGASFSNHTGIYPRHPIVQVDFDPLQLGKFHSVTVPVWGELSVRGARCSPTGCPATSSRATDQRGDVAARRAIWQRREGAPRARRPRPRRQQRRRLRRADAAMPRGCGDRRRRRQQHVLLRALLRVHAPASAC